MNPFLPKLLLSQESYHSNRDETRTTCISGTSTGVPWMLQVNQHPGSCYFLARYCTAQCFLLYFSKSLTIFQGSSGAVNPITSQPRSSGASQSHRPLYNLWCDCSRPNVWTATSSSSSLSSSGTVPTLGGLRNKPSSNAEAMSSWEGAIRNTHAEDLWNWSNTSKMLILSQVAPSGAR